ncbi:hypothetical protein OAQ99_06625 [Candidatus Kapabacteria bacterium]|nr:hypothetical protein [Candidatus Kapabacteria bacterium]
MNYLLLIIFLQLQLFAFDPSGKTNLTRSSISLNPALIDTNGFGFSYIPNSFKLKELSSVKLYAYYNYLLPQSIIVSNLNNELYNEFVLNYNIGMNFSETYQISTGFTYTNKFIINHISENNYKINLSGRVKVFKNLYAGFYFDNIIGNSSPDTLSDATQYLDMSLAWVLDSSLALSFGATNINPGNSWFSATVFYKFNDSYKLNFKVYGTDLRFQIGFGIRINEFLFSPEFDYHSKLGYSERYLIEYLY